MGKKVLVSVITLFFLFFHTFAKDSYVFAVLSSEDPVSEYKRYKILSTYLSNKLNKPVKLIIVRKVDDFLEMYERNLIDISISCPVIYQAIKESYNAEALTFLKINNEVVEAGVWVVRKDSNINSIENLKDKKVTLGSSICASNCIMPLYLLKQRGISYQDIPDMWSSGTDKAAILNVLAGLADAAGVKEESAKKYLDKGLKIIGKSPYVPRYIVAVSHNLEKKEVQKIKNILLNIKDKNLLEKMGIDGFVEVKSSLLQTIKNYKKILNSYPLLK